MANEGAVQKGLSELDGLIEQIIRERVKASAVVLVVLMRVSEWIHAGLSTVSPLASGSVPQVLGPNVQSVGSVVGKLNDLAEEIGRSQRFGQPLAMDTTQKWAVQLKTLATEVNEALAKVPT